MALIVQKFGGTSVGTIERIRHVASWILDTQAQGYEVVAVVSAMSGETDRLIALANQLKSIPFSKEYDLLVSSGEQISVGLVTLAINAEAERRVPGRGTAARGLLGHQIGILTDSVFSKARIQAIDTTLLKTEISRRVIPVIAGFQGVDPEHNITTLGRGGSDTSAVAIAAALKANQCEIYTDVEGVYTADPRLCPDARKIKKISYEEMMELAGLGAKVLQIRSVELAAKYQLQLHVRSSFNSVEGTQVVAFEKLEKPMEQVLVTGVAAESSQVKFTVQNLPDLPGVAARIFQILSEESVVVDVIVQDVTPTGKVSIGFTVGQTDQLKVEQALQRLQSLSYPEIQILQEGNLAKVSIVGVGMRNCPGVASQMFGLLSDAEIRIRMISTSEIKISCLIREQDMQKAVQCLHQGFELHQLESG